MAAAAASPSSSSATPTTSATTVTATATEASTATPTPMIQITIRTRNTAGHSDTWLLDVPLTTSIKQLARLISPTGSWGTERRLLYQGRLLPLDNETLDDHNIIANPSIIWMEANRGSCVKYSRPRMLSKSSFWDHEKDILPFIIMPIHGWSIDELVDGVESMRHPSLWQLTWQPPPTSVYHGGTFYVIAKLPQGTGIGEPHELYFHTPIYHPRVDVVTGQWYSSAAMKDNYSLYQIIDHINTHLLHPLANDATLTAALAHDRLQRYQSSLTLLQDGEPDSTTHPFVMKVASQAEPAYGTSHTVASLRATMMKAASMKHIDAYWSVDRIVCGCVRTAASSGWSNDDEQMAADYTRAWAMARMSASHLPFYFKYLAPDIREVIRLLLRGHYRTHAPSSSVSPPRTVSRLSLLPRSLLYVVITMAIEPRSVPYAMQSPTLLLQERKRTARTALNGIGEPSEASLISHRIAIGNDLKALLHHKQILARDARRRTATAATATAVSIPVANDEQPGVRP